MSVDLFLFLLFFFIFITTIIFFFKYGYTALMYASQIGHSEIAKFLIENNANVNIQNDVFLSFFLFKK
jgi:ankyrin repeat protein